MGRRVPRAPDEVCPSRVLGRRLLRRTQPTGEIPLPEERPLREREELFEGLEELLPRIAELGPVLPLDEVLALPWDWVPMGAGAMRHTREAATKRIAQAAKWPVHRPHLRVESLLAPLEAALEGLEIGRLRR